MVFLESSRIFLWIFLMFWEVSIICFYGGDRRKRGGLMFVFVFYVRGDFKSGGWGFGKV